MIDRDAALREAQAKIERLEQDNKRANAMQVAAYKGQLAAEINADKARADEREACAKIADTTYTEYGTESYIAKSIAATIRARKDTP